MTTFTFFSEERRAMGKAVVVIISQTTGHRRELRQELEKVLLKTNSLKNRPTLEDNQHRREQKAN